MNICNVPISIGELYDKYSILLIKKEKINENDKLYFINKEIEYLQPFINKFNLPLEIVERMRSVNEKLWNIEDDIRIKEDKQEFDEKFITLARMVYKTNDDRHKIKCEINTIINSEIREIKSYK
jgi:hypothetical protein